MVALGGTSVLGDFILLRGTNSKLRTFLGGTFRKKHPVFALKKITKMESRTISQILMISVQKDSPRLQVGPPNQPGRTLCLPFLPHPLILPCSPLLPSIPQSAPFFQTTIRVRDPNNSSDTETRRLVL